MPEPSQERLAALRAELHARAELPGAEERTAAYLADLLAACRPARLETGLGGHGLAAVFAGHKPGPCIGLRAELDAVPGPDGPCHVCGHDGHMAMLAGVALSLAQEPPPRGRVLLLFQPAEETGAGAPAVLSDPRWPGLAPEMIFALHNLPGLPLGQVAGRPGSMCLASVGLRILLTGRAAHAGYPEQGLSPAPALCRLVAELPGMAHGEEKVTVTHARLGAESFGTAPGQAEAWATLRAPSDEGLAALEARCQGLADNAAQSVGLEVALDWHERFPATANHPCAVERLRRAAQARGLDFRETPSPFPWSEDFGAFTAQMPGALFCLGAGEDHAALHSTGYCFPDELLPLGVGLWLELLRQAWA